MSLTWNPLVAVALGTSAVVATLGPLVLGFVLWRRGAPLKAWFLGALTFLVSQVVLRLPWQVALNGYLAPRLKDDVLLTVGWIAFSAFTAALFEETGRWVVFERLWKDRSARGGVMLGAGHGGLESVLLVGLSLISSTVLYVAVTHGQMMGLPDEALELVVQQFEAVTPLLALLGGVERVAAMMLHIGCSLLVLEGARRGEARWLGRSIAVHFTLNTVGVALTKWVNPYVAEAAMLVLAVAVLTWASSLSPWGEGRGEGKPGNRVSSPP